MNSAAVLSGCRPTWVEVDLGAVLRNYRALESFLRSRPSLPVPVPPRVIPVIKADAYGHGALQVAQVLERAGATAFAVALVEEGLRLRGTGTSAEILILQGAYPGQEDEAIRQGLTLALSSPAAVRRLEDACRRCGLRARAHIKIDTGMSRLGVPWQEMGPLIRALSEAPGIAIAGTFSHLAAADSDAEFTAEQARRFEHALAALRAAGIAPGEIHLANSAGLLHSRTPGGQSARPGIALYGYGSSPVPPPFGLERALTLKTRLGHIHTIAPGESAGYNRRFVASRPTRAATLPAGYADGYRRALSPGGAVVLRGRWAPLLGTVSMDMIVADITDIPDAGEGDEVILLGASAGCVMDAARMAEISGTIPYEILCGIGPRVPRVYLPA